MNKTENAVFTPTLLALYVRLSCCKGQRTMLNVMPSNTENFQQCYGKCQRMFSNTKLPESGKELHMLRETTEAEEAVVTKSTLNLMLSNAEQC